MRGPLRPELYMSWWKEVRAALTGSGAGPSPAGSVPVAHISAAAAASPPSNSAVPFPQDDSKYVRQRLRLECSHTASTLPGWPRAGPGLAAVECATRRYCPARVAELFAGSVSAPSQHVDCSPNQVWGQMQPHHTLTVTIYLRVNTKQHLTLTGI